MSKCVYRTDLCMRPVSDPHFCIDAIDLFFRPDMPTVSQCIQRLVAPDEICLGASDKRAIMRGPRVIGYVLIIDECAWASDAASHCGAKDQ